MNHNQSKGIAYTKIPESTLNRSQYKQTVAVEIAFTTDCPVCGAPAGYYCVSKTLNKIGKYHQKRFDAFMRKSTFYSNTSRGTKREELKGH